MCVCICKKDLGTLLNLCASRGSEVFTIRRQIIELRTKCKTKQVGKNTPTAIKERRECDLLRLEQLETYLPRVEGEFFGLWFLTREIVADRNFNQRKNS